MKQLTANSILILPVPVIIKYSYESVQSSISILTRRQYRTYSLLFPCLQRVKTLCIELLNIFYAHTIVRLLYHL